jgi:glucosamine kinase
VDGDLFLGVDAGGTGTRAVLVDEEGTVLSEGVSGAGNPLSVGEEVALRSVREAVARALGGHSPARLGGVHLGVAGSVRPEGAARTERVARGLGLSCPITVSDDAKIAFYAAGDPPGAVLICGTGSIAVAYAGDGRTWRTGGHGYLLGDEGGGAWIGREAVRAALRGADGRGEPTELTRLVPDLLGLGSLDDVVSAVYAGGVGPPGLAALAPEILALDDLVAARIGATAAGELILAVRAALRGVGLESEPVNLVLSGGLLRKESSLRHAVEERLTSELPHARVLPGSPVPVLGAARLAKLASEGRGGHG